VEPLDDGVEPSAEVAAEPSVEAEVVAAVAPFAGAAAVQQAAARA